MCTINHTIESIEAFTLRLDFDVDVLSAIVDEIPIGAMNAHRDRIYNFCIRWAIHHCLINNIDANASSVENVRKQLGKVNDYIYCTDSEFIKRYEDIQRKCLADSILKNVPNCITTNFNYTQLCSLSKRPKTKFMFRVPKPSKLLGVRIGSVYRHGRTCIDVDRNRDK